MTAVSPLWVRIDVPDRFKIMPKGMAEACEWKLKRSNGSYLIRTLSSIEPGQAPLVSVSLVADASHVEHDRFRRAAAAVQHGPNTLSLSEFELPLSVTNPSSREDFWAMIRLRLTIAPDEELATTLSGIFRLLQTQLPETSLWLVSSSPAISWRASAARALFAADEQPEILDPLREFEGFSFPHQLSKSFVMGLDAFVQPMIMTMAPWLIGMTAIRRYGAFVSLFGQVEPGFIDSQAPELMNLLRAEWATQPSQGSLKPTFLAQQGPAIVQYWTERVNRLMAIATDPVPFRTPDGTYAAQAHLAYLLSIERLFATVQEVLAHADRDPNARQLFCFSALDQLEGLRIGASWTNMYSPKYARRTLERLEMMLPADVRDPLLWRCRRAVDGLDALRALVGPAERIHSGRVSVRTEKGGFAEISLDLAVARYLRVLRNAHHSFRDMSPASFSILATQRDVPANAVADIALLYLLSFLEDPRLPPVEAARRRWGSMDDDRLPA